MKPAYQHLLLYGLLFVTLLLLVPRHPQRFDAVADMAAGLGFKVQRRSAWTTLPPRSVFVVPLLDEPSEPPAILKPSTTTSSELNT